MPGTSPRRCDHCLPGVRTELPDKVVGHLELAIEIVVLARRRNGLGMVDHDHRRVALAHLLSRGTRQYLVALAMTHHHQHACGKLRAHGFIDQETGDRMAVTEAVADLALSRQPMLGNDLLDLGLAFGRALLLIALRGDGAVTLGLFALSVRGLRGGGRRGSLAVALLVLLADDLGHLGLLYQAGLEQ